MHQKRCEVCSVGSRKLGSGMVHVLEVSKHKLVIQKWQMAETGSYIRWTLLESLRGSSMPTILGKSWMFMRRWATDHFPLSASLLSFDFLFIQQLLQLPNDLWAGRKFVFCPPSKQIIWQWSMHEASINLPRSLCVGAGQETRRERMKVQVLDWSVTLFRPKIVHFFAKVKVLERDISHWERACQFHRDWAQLFTNLKSPRHREHFS